MASIKVEYSSVALGSAFTFLGLIGVIFSFFSINPSYSWLMWLLIPGVIILAQIPQAMKNRQLTIKRLQVLTDSFQSPITLRSLSRRFKVPRQELEELITELITANKLKAKYDFESSTLIPLPNQEVMNSLNGSEVKKQFLTCPKCGGSVNISDLFCPQCGTSLKK